MCAARFAPVSKYVKGLGVIPSSRPEASSSSLQESKLQNTLAWLKLKVFTPPIFPVSYCPAEKIYMYQPMLPSPLSPSLFLSIFFISLCLAAGPERHMKITSQAWEGIRVTWRRAIHP